MNIFKSFNTGIVVKAIKLMGKRGRTFFLMILGFNIVEAACVPLGAYGLKGTINAVILGDDSLFRQSIILVAINIILWCSYAPISSYICNWASKKSIWEIKSDLARHLIHLPQKYHDSKPTGEILSLMTNDLGCLQNIYDWSYFQVIRSAVIGISGLLTMLIIDRRFALIVFTLGTVSVYTTSYFSGKLEKTGKMLQTQLSRNSTDFYELIKAAKTIRLLGLSKQKAENFNERTQLEAGIRVENTKTSAKMSSIVTLLNSLSYILILIVGALFVYYRLSDWGVVIALAGLKDAADDLFSKFGIYMAGMQTSIAGVKRVLAAMSENEETLDTDLYQFKTQLNDPNTVLSVHNISFSYDSEKEVFEGVNAQLEIGKLTVLLGESGSGKSSLMKTLLSLYEPTDGRIVFKGSTGESITLESLRQKTAYVPQEAILFRGSIYDNIANGTECASYEDIVAAARAAGVDGFISQMPGGYDTILYDDGKSLSGGQRQRIAIARALVKKAPILLLDEITSALDPENEAKILDTVNDLKKDHAILLITHKPDIAQYADKIIRISCTLRTEYI